MTLLAPIKMPTFRYLVGIFIGLVVEDLLPPFRLY
ncbi:MAG: hypothetical protein JWN38_991 [Candidatus Saccharibacteria bacterium]|nr:hypothetical protein [Candidatus Saccharibacteria bacterium]